MGLSAVDDGTAKQRHRLHLVLVSTLSSLPLVVLPDALNAVSDAIRHSSSEEQQQLAKEVFKEIMENVGDLESVYCLRWWEEQRDALEGAGEETSGKGKGLSLSARM